MSTRALPSHPVRPSPPSPPRRLGPLGGPLGGPLAPRRADPAGPGVLAPIFWGLAGFSGFSGLASLCVLPAGCAEQPGVAAPAGPVDAATWPPGTVLAVDGWPVTQAEVDRVAGWVALLEPAKVLAERRRVALNELVLPRAVLAAGARESRAQALELAASETPAAEPAVLRGPFDALGLAAYGLASELEPGERSAPFEAAGRVLCLELLSVEPSPLPGLTTYEVRLWSWPFVSAPPTRAELLERAASCRLALVDPAWSEFVPVEWRYRMRGDMRGDQP